MQELLAAPFGGGCCGGGIFAGCILLFNHILKEYSRSQCLFFFSWLVVRVGHFIVKNEKGILSTL